MTPTVRRSVGGWSTWSHAVAFDAPGNNANLKDKNKKRPGRPSDAAPC